MVDKLREIKIGALAKTGDEVCDTFEVCCGFLDSHKQPIETLDVPAKLKDLKRHWKRLQEIRSLCNKSG